MVSTQFGNFHDFCAHSTLPICNIFNDSPTNGGHGFGACELKGLPLPGHDGANHLNNLGSIIFAFFAILTTIYLILRSERKVAAVGRREMQIFLIGFVMVEICEIFSVGGFPLPPKVRLGFTAVHLAAIAATSWVLMLNAFVGFQLVEDGTAMSVGAVIGSAGAIFIGTGYITLDTAFKFTGFFNNSLAAPNYNPGLYVLYQLLPLVCIVVFFAVEAFLVLRVLGERRPLLYLLAAFVLFAIGQVFQYAVSRYICTGTMGKIDGALFETLFTWAAVTMTWVFWSSITEDDWKSEAEPSYT